MNKIELKKYIEEKILTKDLKVRSAAVCWGYLDNIKDELDSFIRDGELEAKNKAAKIFADSIGKEFKFLFNENNNLNKFKDIIKENING